MNGYIRRRSTDSWQVVIELGRDPVTGKRKRVSRNVVGAKRDAETERTALLRSIETGTYVDPTRELVAEFLARWLRDYARPVVAPRTYERYEEIVRLHIVPTLGRVPLTQLRPTHIVAAERQWLDAGLSPATVLKHHRLIRQTLQQAMRWRVLTVNPADAVTPPRRERTEMSVLDRDQAAALLNAAQGSEFEVLILTALYTGLRVGELLGLRWKDVDLTARQLRVQQAAQPVKGGGVAYAQPKTHRSRRAVSLPGPVTEALQRQRHLQARARLAAGAAWQASDLVFTNSLGGPVSRTSLRRVFHELLDRAGAPRIRLHDLRHTMATLMLAVGEHPKVVSERLGHATVGVTLDTYSHVLPGLQAAAADRLAATLSSAGRAGMADPLESANVDRN